MKKKLKIITMVSFLLVFANCSSDSEIKESGNNSIVEENDTFVNTSPTMFNRISSSNTVTFNTTDQQINSLSIAEAIFNNEISQWNNNIANISDNKLKIDLQASYGTSGAMTSLIDVADGAKYQLTFNLKFDEGFDWSRGGKVGFGFFIGDGVTGGNNLEATEQNKGGSFRVMWRKDTTGNPYFIPYVYYKGMSGQYGDDFDTYRYNNLLKNKWYRIRLTVHVNTLPEQKDGYAKMEVSSDFGENYTTVWEKNDMWWSGGTEPNLKVKKINFHVFRGGGNSTWDGNNGTQSIYFDTLSWERL
ncbi:polysaccharide lyase [Flavobacterium faecale]|uniref:polysaccharide lyase n=1 Tax=Flavobacterium faecale TaxID=1355330 RepID=UPI003AACC008